MIDAVSDEMIEAFAVVGTPDEARRKLAPYAELADSICLTPPDQLVSPEEAASYRTELVNVFGR
jgi:alkanesulfonate monooxygenase SsuD/methylene tetrahydromethanopterin reductase-like flavin-dependent oxidoreductase (luciferase family)